MGEMTLPSKHRIRNLNPGNLRPSTLPLGHGGSLQYEFYELMGKKHFCFFQTAEIGGRTPNSSVKGSDSNNHLRAPHLASNSPASRYWITWVLYEKYDERSELFSSE